jgi:hypothetical protein
MIKQFLDAEGDRMDKRLFESANRVLGPLKQEHTVNQRTPDDKYIPGKED